MRGSLLAGEALLSHGADLRLQDGRGYTACHVAAQYGQTAFIYMCALRWRADIDRWAEYSTHGCIQQVLAKARTMCGSQTLPESRRHISDLIGMCQCMGVGMSYGPSIIGRILPCSPDIYGRTPL